jgi:hypothetical protein
MKRHAHDRCRVARPRVIAKVSSRTFLQSLVHEACVDVKPVESGSVVVAKRTIWKVKAKKFLNDVITVSASQVLNKFSTSIESLYMTGLMHKGLMAIIVRTLCGERFPSASQPRLCSPPDAKPAVHARALAVFVRSTATTLRVGWAYLIDEAQVETSGSESRHGLTASSVTPIIITRFQFH